MSGRTRVQLIFMPRRQWARRASISSWVARTIRRRGRARRIFGTDHAHWAPFLTAKNRCLVPATSFCEPDQDHQGTRKNVGFALEDSRPLFFFAGLFTPHACVRMKSKGWEEIDAFGFLTTESAEPVKTYHKKAMPVILTDKAEWDLWLSDAPWEAVKALQRPQPERLKMVAHEVRKDEALPA
jgi:putative SOS response-associated peptidase YedK